MKFSGRGSSIGLPDSCETWGRVAHIDINNDNWDNRHGERSGEERPVGGVLTNEMENCQVFCRSLPQARQRLIARICPRNFLL